MNKPLVGACVFGQSGGPTSVINASAYGVIRTALDCEHITNVYGAAHGICGVLEGKLYDMGQEDASELELLLHSPSSALGSCRYKLADFTVDDKDYKKILDVFKRLNVRYFFYNGGNDSMDTCSKISRYFKEVGYECHVMGVPKTIDNDLFGTDHCPGYGSAARYIATSCMEIHEDAKVYDTGQIVIIEIMGRHAGWLTAASALAGYMGAGPDLIYLPEVAFDLETFLADVSRLYEEKGKVLIAVSEGICDANGKLIAEYQKADQKKTDAFGHVQLGGLAAALTAFVKARTGAKVRGIEFSLLQRSAAHLAAKRDIDESFLAGKTAVEAAVEGQTGKMVAFSCSREDGYQCQPILIPLESVANVEKKLPLTWINEAGNGLKQEFIDYALPLIQGEITPPQEHSLPRFARLKKVEVTLD